MPVDVEGYRDYVGARLEPLRRTAYLLCGDWHTADDLVSATLVKLLRHWSRVSVMDNPDAYARRILLRVWLDERRRPWRREAAWAEVPDRAVAATGTDGAADRLTLLALLAELPPRRRAVLVLRYFCDLSVEETARELGCTPGTVKSQSARGIEAMRARLAPMPDRVEEVRNDG
ncbi:SigE family RNA polymerase sigma factor [Micromonospora saelicesensis]|jgi:RNA polymerase sigma-70 factor (sigma-E family)|uniref:RNA polymerase sigma-70 factor, sigma-E family n=1 Tax=Micromonospora saelicesensis TaxID=285676 RepID=A0A1C4V1L5_9ACTN|nr:SigE family RNA polymerase sigma factor [Micromonospora saelicesensis]RAO57616.1 RNA polymerase sigma-E factor [Micromonospora saelicesensis]SCE77649.1 RNA polymerase sigma-70 factor, sigma-E family [Micromonospora saelicesensis]